MYVRTYVGGDDNPCCHLKLWLEWSSCEGGGNWVKGHLPGSSSVLKSEVMTEALITWFQLTALGVSNWVSYEQVWESWIIQSTWAAQLVKNLQIISSTSCQHLSHKHCSQCLVEQIIQKNWHKTVSGQNMDSVDMEKDSLEKHTYRWLPMSLQS